MRIVHIASHLGGGVGKIISSICEYEGKFKNEYEHKIILLEEPEKTQFINIAKSNGVEVIIKPSMEIIKENLVCADIVQVEWWHHPIMCEFLYNFPNIPVRLIIWSHISGCSYPFIKKIFLMNCNRFLFTSPYSLENHYLEDEEVKKFLYERTDIVYSSGGFKDVILKKHEDNDTFNIGYVGTLNFSKLNPEFVRYCNEVNLPNAKFILVGDINNKNEILSEEQEKYINERFEFVGYTNDVQSQLNRMDVFGYPLNSQHYGTTENALLEAMVTGVPPVVLNQCTEKYIVKHMETGIIVNNPIEYGEAIRYLYNNIDERIRLGSNARKYVIENYALKNTVYNLRKNYNLAMKNDKKLVSFKLVLGDTPAEWFLSCLGEESKIFKKSMNIDSMKEDEFMKVNGQIITTISNSEILQGNKKSSLFHFLEYFHEDNWLRYWGNLFKNKNNQEENSN